jgi:hypothetical protein
MNFGQPRAGMSDKKKGGGFLSGLFGRKTALADDSDSVKVYVNIDVDDDDKKRPQRRITKRRKPATKTQAAAPKRTAPKPTAPKRKRTTAKAAAPKPSVKKKAAAAPKKQASAVVQSNALRKRRSKRKRQQERDQNVSIAAFGSTKRRLGLRDDVATDTDALMDDIDTSIALDDCSYTEQEETVAGLADKEPTDAQAKKINRINERLRDLEGEMGEKYRAAFSARSEKGYVLRKFVGVDEKIQTWGDPYIARRPVGIGGKTLERVFTKKHGVSWEDFARESETIRALRAKIEKHNGTTTAAQRTKAETAALKERQKEEREIAAKAKAEAAKLKREAEAKAKTAKVQEAKAEKAEKVAKVAKAKAKKEPTKTNKAAAQAAEKKAVVEEKKVEKIEKEVEKLEAKAEKVEAKAEAAEDKNEALDKEILELAKIFA